MGFVKGNPIIGKLVTVRRGNHPAGHRVILHSLQGVLPVLFFDGRFRHLAVQNGSVPGNALGLGGQTVFPFNGLQTGVIHRVEHFFLLGKFHFSLCGVHVYVHGAVGNIHIQHAGGIPSGEQTVPISHFQTGLHHLGANGPAVDEEELVGAVAPSGLRRGHKAPHPNVVISRLAGNHGLKGLPTQQTIHAGIRFPVSRREKLFFAVFDAPHGNIRPAQGAFQRRLYAGCALGPVAFQKFQPSGGVVKQIPDNHGGTLRAAGFVHILNFSGGQCHVHPGIRAPLPGSHFNVGNGGNSGQCLAPEPKGADAFQSALVLQLTGGMAEKGDAGIVRGHALSVVGNPNIGDAAPAQLHRDGFCAGIESVFQQLLHHRCRAVHHLAGGNQVGDMGRKYLNFGHKYPPLQQVYALHYNAFLL